MTASVRCFQPATPNPTASVHSPSAPLLHRRYAGSVRPFQSYPTYGPRIRASSSRSYTPVFHFSFIFFSIFRSRCSSFAYRSYISIYFTFIYIYLYVLHFSFQSYAYSILIFSKFFEADIRHFKFLILELLHFLKQFVILHSHFRRRFSVLRRPYIRFSLI